MNKHTKGPWFADNGDGQYCGVFGAHGEPIAYLVEPKGNNYELLPLASHDEWAGAQEYPKWHEHEDNARLIAAAPDLLEALENAVGDLKAIIEVRGDSIDLTQYRAAIAKAKGEDQ